MSPVTLPGDLVSPVAGALLRRGCPVRVPGDDGIVTAVYTHADTGVIDHVYVSFDEEVRSCELAAFSLPALDLSDPAGRDIAARWLAAHHGLTVGATAPSWTSSRGGASDAADWLLDCCGRMNQYRVFTSHPRAKETTYTLIVPGISALTDPAEALRAACLAAVGRTAGR